MSEYKTPVEAQMVFPECKELKRARNVDESKYLHQNQAHLFIGKLAWNNNAIDFDVVYSEEDEPQHVQQPMEIISHDIPSQPELYGFKSAMIRAGQASLNQLMELPDFEIRELQAA